MTTSTAEEVARRRDARARRRRARTFADDFGGDLRHGLLDQLNAQGETLRALSGALTHDERARYRRDPAAFARDYLGVSLWAKQVEILEAVRDHRRVAIRSGHKVGKSFLCAVLALWFYMCFDDARVVLTAATARQVDTIIWREIRKLVRVSKRPIDGDARTLARSGIHADDFREITGFAAREAEAVAGVSGANILYIADEASGIGDDIFDAIDGNRAGGANARLVMISNPTKTTGRFFEAFHAKAASYCQLHVSSLESPNVVAGREIVRGLAAPEWVAEMRAEWGEDSPWWKIRVLGEFVTNDEAKILSLDLIAEAESRWEALGDEQVDGRLQVGIDPAGPGGAGDESAFAVRRGTKVLEVLALRGLSPEMHVKHARDMVTRHRRKREPKPLFVIDREGHVGARVFGAFEAAEDDRGDFELVGVRSSENRTVRRKREYLLVRDELWGNLAQWLKEGGAIPSDTKLEADLHVFGWEDAGNGRVKLSPSKDEARKLLGRSPDRGDAVCLCVWTPIAVVANAPDDHGGDASGGDDDITPYAGDDAISPYDDGGRSWR